MSAMALLRIALFAVLTMLAVAAGQAIGAGMWLGATGCGG